MNNTRIRKAKKMAHKKDINLEYLFVEERDMLSEGLDSPPGF
jgi:hypothetical protein